jgi:hypothetical protein
MGFHNHVPHRVVEVYAPIMRTSSKFEPRKTGLKPVERNSSVEDSLVRQSQTRFAPLDISQFI